MRQVEESIEEQRQFDQRPEQEVKAERINRLYAEHNRCGRCGLAIDSIEDADVVLMSGYARLVHRELCPEAQAPTVISTREALRQLFPGAVLELPSRQVWLRGRHRND